MRSFKYTATVCYQQPGGGRRDDRVVVPLIRQSGCRRNRAKAAISCASPDSTRRTRLGVKERGSGSRNKISGRLVLALPPGTRGRKWSMYVGSWPLWCTICGAWLEASRQVFPYRPRNNAGGAGVRR